MEKNPHDMLFRRAFGDPAEATPLLRSVLPDEMNRNIDWASLKVTDGSYVEEGLKELRSDILYEASTNTGQVGLLYVLMEHQSTVDPMMAFRMLQYVSRVWARWRRENPKAKRLPEIVPIVMYIGQRPWTAATSFEALVDGADAPWTPKMSFVLDDLSRVSEAELAERALQAFGEVCLRVLRDLPSSTDPIGVLNGLREQLKRVSDEPDGLDRLVSVLVYLSRVANVELEGVQEVVRTIQPDGEKSVMSTLAQRMEQEALIRGREEGRHQARAQTILHLLQLKFGELTEDTVGKVESGTEAEFELWTERVLVADELAQIFEG